jgi:hypothetical protein
MPRLLWILLGSLAAAPAAAADSPPDVSHEPWFTQHCAPLSAERVAHYEDVARRAIGYAWRSDTGYLWDWENGQHAGSNAHYCTRVALYNRRGRLIETITMLCSVADRGKSTEVWTFGNADIAKRLCPASKEQLKAIDRR